MNIIRSKIKMFSWFLIVGVLAGHLAHAKIDDGDHFTRTPSPQRLRPSSDFKPHYCNYILNTYILANGDLEKLQDIDEIVANAQDVREKTRRPFTVMADLAMVFDSGLIFRALGSELRARGHKSKTEMEIALTLFSAKENNQEEQVTFVNAVVKRMLQMIGPLDLSMDEVKSIQKRSGELGFTPGELTALMRALGTQAADDFVLLKLALLEELFSGHGKLPQALEREMSSFAQMTRFFQRDHLKGWVNMPEAPIGRRADAEKMMTLKLSNLERRVSQKPESLDHEVEKIIRELQIDYVFWLSSSYFETIQPHFFKLAIEIQSDEIFSQTLTALYQISYAIAPEATQLMPALQEIFRLYDGKNRSRWEKTQTLITQLTKQIAEDATMAEQNRVHSIRRAEEASRSQRSENSYGWCFTGDTLVDTPNGRIPIEQLKAGDLVYTFNPVTQTVEIEPVLNPIRHFSRDYLNVQFSYGTSLKVTAEHPFYSPRLKRFVRLSELPVGEKVLVRTDDHKTQDVTVEITAKVKGGNADVYNVEIRNHHNYFVNGILVHNIKVS